MIADILLFSAGFLGLLIGSITDLKTREVSDWMNYALITAGIGIRLLHSLVTSEWSYFFIGLGGLAIMLVIGNIMYYTRQWGGGDTKLLIALGVIFATTPYFVDSRYPFLIALFVNIIFFGALFGIVWSISLAMKHKEKFLKDYKEILKSKIMRNLKSLIFISILAFAASLLLIGDIFISIILGAVAVFAIVYAYSWALMKAVENSCMYKIIPISKLTLGDWVVSDEIRKKYNISQLGVEKTQLEALRNSKLRKIEIKEGIPFVPSFLIGFLITALSGKMLLLF